MNKFMFINNRSNITHHIRVNEGSGRAKVNAANTSTHHTNSQLDK